jgi:hypothetical protein
MLRAGSFKNTIRTKRPKTVSIFIKATGRAPPEKQKHVLCVIIFEQGKVKVIIHRNKKRWNKGFKQERGKAQKWKFTTL